MSEKQEEVQEEVQKGLIQGVIPDKIDDRDYMYRAKLAGDSLPASIDLRQHAGEVENQLDTGSCVANAACSALELMTQRSGKATDLSRLFVYWNVREPYSNLRGKDVGSYLRDAFKSINKLGVPDESEWDFDSSKVNVKPGDEVYTSASANKVLEYRRIYRKDLSSIKDALRKGYPVIFSAGLGSQFLNLSGNLADHKYGPINPWSNKLIGYHAMNIVGYDDNLKAFIVENSWSDQWGDSGYCKFSYLAFVRDSIDVWVCTNFEYNGVPIEPEPQEPEPQEPEPQEPEPQEPSFDKDEIQGIKQLLELYKLIKTFFNK